MHRWGKIYQNEKQILTFGFHFQFHLLVGIDGCDIRIKLYNQVGGGAREKGA